MMKKLILLASFFGLTLTINAQQQICFGTTHTYTVDAVDGPGGTPGSTYSWSVPTAGFAGVITNIANSASINWATTPAGTYTLEVTETNNGCIGSVVSLSVIVNPIITLPAPTINLVNSTICYLDSAEFEITGGANQTLTYNINSGANQTITLNAQGEATVTLNNVTGNQTLTITSITSSTICSFTNVSVSETVNVNAVIVTSPIGF